MLRVLKEVHGKGYEAFAGWTEHDFAVSDSAKFKTLVVSSSFANLSFLSMLMNSSVNDSHQTLQIEAIILGPAEVQFRPRPWIKRH